MTKKTSNTVGMRYKPRQARSQERVNRILNVAEKMFVTEGYSATTTNAIAARAGVSIGSLYQFFPDKNAIVQAIAARYERLLRQQLALSDRPELAKLPLPIYVDRIIDTTDRFFSDYPAYHAIFMQIQGTTAELEEIEDAADMLLVRDLAISLAQREGSLAGVDYEAIAFVLVKAIGTLLWLSLSQKKTFRQHLIVEAKQLVLSYLQSHFPD